MMMMTNKTFQIHLKNQDRIWFKLEAEVEVEVVAEVEAVTKKLIENKQPKDKSRKKRLIQDNRDLEVDQTQCVLIQKTR